MSSWEQPAGWVDPARSPSPVVVRARCDMVAALSPEELEQFAHDLRSDHPSVASALAGHLSRTLRDSPPPSDSPPPPHSPPTQEALNYEKLTNKTIRHAVGLWCDADRRDEAQSMYGDISDWDVGQVTRMSSLFDSQELFNDDIGRWDVSRVTNMQSMFYGATAFNQPLGSWDVSRCVNMNSMFHAAIAFNQPLDAWDTSGVTTMYSTFRDAIAFNQPLDAWDTSNVMNMGRMFDSTLALEQRPRWSQS